MVGATPAQSPPTSQAASRETPETTSGLLWPGAGAFDGEGLSAKPGQAVRRGNPMDQRIEAFLADVLALAS